MCHRLTARVDLAGYGPSPLCPFPSWDRPISIEMFPTQQGKVPVSIQRYAHQMKVFHGLQEPCLTILFS
uniref:Uncharacterized protein n=1 Tax=Picea glauca TaxID=3330 RepID=A0A101M0R6_PICGL|nr:hypothetical protein ABT39_MTgene4247 [Picea glauca]QHR89552.1 hypothetical protein Q903MT_gene3574 [Picea sitchensis]